MYIFQTTIALLLVIGSLITFFIRNRQKYWERLNVSSAQESIFFFGRTQHAGIYFQSVYNRFRNVGHPFVGCFSVFTPAALLLDLDLIKRVLISDFEHFPDRGFYHNVQDDPLSSNLMRVSGNNWHRLRSRMTPNFTPRKIKIMFPTKVVIGKRLIKSVLNSVTSGKRELEMHDLCSRYTIDIIATVAFGIECNSLANPDTEFRLFGDKAFKCSRPLLESVASVYPKFFQYFHTTVFSQELIKFYTEVVRQTVAIRAEQQIQQNYFVDILIELTKTHSSDKDSILTLDEIIGEVFVFFVAGYEASSSVISHCLYELSKNPAIQERARNDIKKTLERFNGELSYECIKEMQYVKQVVEETLRKHPVAPVLRRIVRKRYLVPNTSVYLEEGVQALIPVYAIHHDPEYYPEPEKFDPSRFSPEEVLNRHPMCYLPFGAGPRVCIAERFGKMEVILGIALLLFNFHFSPSQKTPKVLQYDITEKRIFKVNSLHLNVEPLYGGFY